jgi:integrase
VKSPTAGSAVQIRPIPSHNHLDHSPLVPHGLSELTLPFTQEELINYAERRKVGLSEYSIDWIDRSQRLVWHCTKGSISKQTVDELRLFILNRYRSECSHTKVLSFAKAFLKYLTKVQLDSRYHAFEVFLERPRAIKARNNVTKRIVTKDDVETVLAHIHSAEQDGLISSSRAKQYIAFVLFSAYSGQRSLATVAKLRVGQFRDALQSDKPCVEVQSSQDKIRMQHYVPLHPQVIQAIKPLLGDRGDDEPLFEYNSFLMWLKRQKIRLTRIKSHFVLGDLRKFAEQYGDIIQWEQSNRAYIMTHGVSGIDWKHYKHPLPENVYDTNMRYWREVDFN